VLGKQLADCQRAEFPRLKLAARRMPFVPKRQRYPAAGDPVPHLKRRPNCYNRKGDEQKAMRFENSATRIHREAPAAMEVGQIRCLGKLERSAAPILGPYQPKLFARLQPASNGSRASHLFEIARNLPARLKHRCVS